VVLHARTQENCERVAGEIEQIGAPRAIVAGELSDEAQVKAIVADALRQAGQIDIVYNNAAIQGVFRQDPWTFPAEVFRQVFEVNVVAVIQICQLLAPAMIARKWGRMINVSSGIKDQPELSPYAVSKGALDKYVRDFAPRLAGTGVSMNLLDPGWLRTDMGGPRAPGDVASVVPGALVPVVIDDGVSGRWYAAQDYAGMTVDEAIASAELRYLM
jgi:NAD(P)-dependent dehydrogenase (short-subunit alcohol dehydrogenase family)